MEISSDTKKLTIKILKGVATVLVGLSSILAAWYAYQGLALQKSQILKESLPFFKYRYSEENRAFVVEAEENVSTHSIQWFFPVSERSFDGFTKNSNQLTIDEITFQIWSALLDRKIYIPSPDSQANTGGYIRCSILSLFDEYHFTTETDTGFPLGVLIEYTRKGGTISYFWDVILLKSFDSATPQIKVAKTYVTEADMKIYMKKGAERLDGILPIYPYDQNRKYIENNKCTQTSTFWKKYFFDETDREELMRPLQENSQN